MEGIGLAILGLVVGLLGALCTYVWKGNHKMEKAILESQKMMMQALERMKKARR